MALLFFDGFETYATADITKDWNSTTGTVAINSAAGRRGGGALLAPNSSQTAAYVAKTLPGNYATLICGFSFKFNAMPTIGGVNIFSLRDAGQTQIIIVLNTDGTLSISRGGITTLGTTTYTLTTNTEYYIEFKATIHDTTGSFELRIDGVNQLSATNQDTKNTANAHANQLLLGATNNPNVMGSIYTYDDLYVLDTTGSAPTNDFLGDCRVDAVLANADGNYTQWTPSTGTDHYALVDDITPNTTDYNSSSTVGQKDSYAMTNPTLNSSTIYGVRAKVAAHKDDAGTKSIKVGVRSGTSDSLSSGQSLATSQLYYSNIHTTDPNTGAAWTQSGLDNMEVVVETA